MRGSDWYGRCGKRALDVAVSLTALLLTLPLIGAVALAVRIGLGSPVLFTQLRPGRKGRPFLLYKFRSMATPKSQADASDEARLTPLGTWMRKLSLDELPQLWNVLKGDMSLVGPRPLLMEYLPLYDPTQARRHEVRPGITGWAQVNGRNALSWEQKFALDVWYVDNASLGVDLKILARTLLKVALTEGISQQGAATMRPFTGSPHDD